MKKFDLMRLVDVKGFVVGALVGVLVVLAMLWASSAKAQDSGVFYNVDRSGEGIFVTVNRKKNTLAFAFFTYWDVKPVEIVIPPVVSPAPPPIPGVPTPTLWSNCPVPAMPATPIYPVVSPPPPATAVPTQRRGGQQAWFIGAGAYQDGIAVGEMYWNHGVDYPNVDPFLGLVVEYEVATFLMEGSGDGFDLYLDCSGHVPKSLFMCNNIMTFRNVLLKAE